MLAVGTFAIVMGLSMAAIWTRDIVSGETIDHTHGRLRARDPGAGTLMLPHWLAEYSTAALLVISGIGLLAANQWAAETALIALGALVYTSLNSLGWVLAERSRSAYAIPMGVGVIGGVTAIATLLIG